MGQTFLNYWLHTVAKQREEMCLVSFFCQPVSASAFLWRLHLGCRSNGLVVSARKWAEGDPTCYQAGFTQENRMANPETDCLLWYATLSTVNIIRLSKGPVIIYGRGCARRKKWGATKHFWWTEWAREKMEKASVGIEILLPRKSSVKIYLLCSSRVRCQVGRKIFCPHSDWDMN